MNLTRTLTVAAALSILASAGVSAATLRHVSPAGHQAQVTTFGSRGGVHTNFTCPPTYFACVSPTKASPYQDGWCVSTSGNCTTGLVGSWNWTSVVAKLGKGFKKVKSTWSPDPGNPSTNTISDARRKAKGTKLIASVTHSTCEVTNGTCFSNFVSYGVTN